MKNQGFPLQNKGFVNFTPLKHKSKLPFCNLELSFKGIKHGFAIFCNWKPCFSLFDFIFLFCDGLFGAVASRLGR